MKALILTDGKPGHANQSIAFCKNTGIDYETVDVRYRSKAAKSLSYLYDRLGIKSEALFQMSSTVENQTSKDLNASDLRPSPFDLIISTGSTSFYPNKVLSKKLGLPNIAILNPSGYRPDFDLILCPAYDHPPAGDNIIELPLNLCFADPAFFQEKTDEFRQKHAQTRPAAGFIIGGPNAVSTLDADDVQQQLEQAFARTDGCERWVTTSRRTPGEVEAVIEALPFDYTLINSRDAYNPVPAFIGLCDRLFVTSDSASMVSEAASFGSAHVEILMNRQLKTPNKFQELFRGLEKQNAVHIFDGTLGNANEKIDLTPRLKQALARVTGR